MQRNKRLPIALFGALVLVLGGYFAWTRTSNPAPNASGSGSGTAGSFDTPCFGPVGHQTALQVRTGTKLHLDLARLLQRLQSPGNQVQLAVSPAINLDYSLLWRLELMRVPDRDGALVLAARIEDLQVVSGQAPDKEAPDLTPTFLVQLDSRCTIEAFARAKDADFQVAKNQQGMVANLGFALPDHPDSTRYPMSGFDLTGRYRADYEQVDTDGRLALRGQIVEYTDVFSGSGGADQSLGSAIRVQSSNIEVVPDSQAWLSEFESDRYVVFLHGPARYGSLQHETKANLTASDESWGEVPEPSSDHWVWGLLLAQPNTGAQASTAGAATDQGVLAQMTLNDALDKLVSGIEQRKGNPATWVTFMRDWLRVHPEAMEALLQRIQDGWLKDAPVFARSNLFLAMALADTPETRAALMQMLTDDSFPRGYALDAAAMLTLASELPEGYYDLVVQEANEGRTAFERSKMSLTLGTLAQEQSRRNPAVAKQATQQLKEWLQAPRDEDQLVATLAGAGNAGPAMPVDAVTPYLEADSVEVRATAASALRNTGDPRAQAALADQYVAETSPLVRSMTLRSLTANARERGTPLPPAVVQNASERLAPDLGNTEFVETVAFLGEAAKEGDPVAQEALRGALREVMDSPNPDASRARMLGQHVKTPFRRPTR